MTGEATLRGLVLPVGGIKEKVLAAHRAGIKRVSLPERCRKDLIDVPEQARNEIEFIFATQMDEVLKAAMESSPFKTPVPGPPEISKPVEIQRQVPQRTRGPGFPRGCQHLQRALVEEPEEGSPGHSPRPGFRFET